MSEALAVPDDAELFKDAEFTKAVQDRTKRRARVAFHGRGIERLIEIADGNDDKTALSAITLLGKLAGEFKAPKQSVVLNFNELMDKKQVVEAGPLGGITQIQAAIIEAVDEPDSDSE